MVLRGHDWQSLFGFHRLDRNHDFDFVAHKRCKFADIEVRPQNSCRRVKTCPRLFLHRVRANLVHFGVQNDRFGHVVQRQITYDQGRIVTGYFDAF